MILALTGHRPSKLGNEYMGTGPVSSALRLKLIDIITRKNPEYIISGMALGADQIWAMAAIELRVPFVAAIPCYDQDILWPNRSRSLYHSILEKASRKVFVTEGPYSIVAMQKRNEWMVDQCTELIAVWDGSSGGTRNCVMYAHAVNKPIIRIDPKLLT